MAIFPGSAITPAGGGYTIDQSLRFNDDDSAYLSRTPASAGNRKTWTWSGWVKRGNLGTTQAFYSHKGGTGTSQRISFFFTSSDTLIISQYNGTSTDFQLTTTQVFRDVASHYHIVFSCDTTQATASDRLTLEVNGVSVTSFSTETYPSLNLDTYMNMAEEANIGQDVKVASRYFDGYLSEMHIVDGQALTPDYFGEADETYGHWKPIEYTGTYGTNGFYLPFSGTFYNDASGNGNNWTANNLATTDVVLDSPTNNFATLNSAYPGITNLQEGNLQWKGTTSVTAPATISPTSGKWYWEVDPIGRYAGSPYIGFVINSLSEVQQGQVDIAANGCQIAMYTGGNCIQSTPGTVAGSTPAFCQGYHWAFAYDADNGKLWIARDGSYTDTLAGSDPSNNTNPAVYGLPSGQFTVCANNVDAGATYQAYPKFNFGQDATMMGEYSVPSPYTDDNGYGSFRFQPPSGFLALCTANLSDPAVVPGENFNTVLYTGTGSDQDITGVGFQPDFTWIKQRSPESISHELFDSVRGVQLALYSDLTIAEYSGRGLDSFDSDGFGLTGGQQNTNQNTYSYVAWNWKADNTSGSSNTDGSITSTVAANVDAGFSIVSYTGTGSNATVGHGLSSAPEMVIVKNRTSASTYWCITTKDIQDTYGNSYILLLPLTNAVSSNSTVFNATQPTSSVFSIGTNGGTNTSGNNYIAYCFHSVDGYSKFGSYTGNGSTDGPFIYTGFRPAFVMVKRTDVASSWPIFDSAREPTNAVKKRLNADESVVEASFANGLDYTSNGFKIRDTSGGINASAGTYIYMAFAENPFKYTTAR